MSKRSSNLLLISGAGPDNARPHRRWTLPASVGPLVETPEPWQPAPACVCVCVTVQFILDNAKRLLTPTLLLPVTSAKLQHGRNDVRPTDTR